MVPNVKNADEAKASVDAAKYAPLGKRGVNLGGANTSSRKVDPAEFLSYANQNTTIICQIESQDGLDDIEGISATPGIDVLWVGHTDLTQSLGIVGEFHHPRFQDALKLVVSTARKHGLAAGIQPGNTEQALEWIEMGFNVISYGSDRSIYLSALAAGIQELRDLAAMS